MIAAQHYPITWSGGQRPAPDPVQQSFDLADDRLHGIAQLVRSNGYKRIARLDCRGQLGIAALKPAARIFVATLGRD